MTPSAQLRAVIYVRVSSKEQTQNLSLPVQEEQCRVYCLAHGMEIDRVFVERGESAKTANRTELQALLTYIREKNRRAVRIHTMVVTNVDRFARDQYDHALIRRHLASLGVTLRAVSQPIDETPAGRFMEGIFSALAQFDNEVRGSRTTAGMREAARRGQWVWKPPLGYAKEDKRTMIPDPESAHLVRYGFERFATGLYSRKQVLNEITALGLRTRQGKELTAQKWGEMLASRVYIGRLVVKGWNLDVAGNWPALVAEDIFWRCQGLLQSTGLLITAKERNNPDFPLRGFVQCGRCGKPLTGSWSKGKQKRYAYYHCPSQGCRRTNLARHELEAQFLALLDQLRPKPEYLRLFRAVVIDVWKSERVDLTTRRVALDRQVKEIQHRKDLLVEAFVFQKSLDEVTYKIQLDKLNEKALLLEIELHETRTEELDIEAVLDFAERVALNASRMWLEADLEQRQRLQSLLFPEGLRAESGGLRTPSTCSFFEEIGGSEQVRERLVAHTGFEPVLPA